MKNYMCSLENSQDADIVEASNMMDAAEVHARQKGYNSGLRVAVESESGSRAVYTLE